MVTKNLDFCYNIIMKTKKSTKFVYIWKIPTTDGIICYIIGDEKTIGGRDRIYENGSKTSENKQLKEFKKACDN